LGPSACKNRRPQDDNALWAIRSDRLLLLDAFFWIPGALEATNVDDLSDVIGVVGTDVGDGGGNFLDRFVVGRFYKLFNFLHHFVELLDGVIPLLGVEGGEGFVVVAAELGRRDPFELVEDLGVPEDQVIGELSDGVVAFAVGPVGLIGRKSFDGNIGGDEPVFIIVRRFELLYKNAAERGWLLVRLILGKSEKWRAEQNQGENSFHLILQGWKKVYTGGMFGVRERSLRNFRESSRDSRFGLLH